MPEEAPAEGEGERDAPAALAVAQQPAQMERLADLVYRLLREDIALMRERRGEIARRWR